MKRIRRSVYGEWMEVKVVEKEKVFGVFRKNDTKPYVVIGKPNAPDNLIPGIWMVQVNLAEKKINAWRPIKGVFTMKVDKFVSKENEQPTPRTRTSKNQYGHEYEVEEFTVLFRIMDGKCKDCVVSNNLPFKFDFDDEGEKKLLALKGYGKATDRLEEFLTVTGVNEFKFPYKDNPLPMLQKAILHEGKTFSVQMEKGWVTAMYQINLPEEDTDFTGDDEAPWEE